MKKILIATDGSESAHEALEFGLELAEEQDAKRSWSTLPRPSRSCRTRLRCPPPRFPTSSANRTGCR